MCSQAPVQSPTSLSLIAFLNSLGQCQTGQSFANLHQVLHILFPATKEKTCDSPMLQQLAEQSGFLSLYHYFRFCQPCPLSQTPFIHEVGVVYHRELFSASDAKLRYGISFELGMASRHPQRKVLEVLDRATILQVHYRASSKLNSTAPYLATGEFLISALDLLFFNARGAMIKVSGAW